MAKEEESTESVEPQDPAVLLKELESKIQTNKFILFAVAALFVMALCILITSYSVIYLKISALENVSLADTEEHIERIQKQLVEMNAYKDREIVSITEMEEKIGLLQDDYQSGKVVIMKRIFMDREADFQRLVDTLLNSTDSLSAMILGPREWVDYHKQEMHTLKKRSIARASAIQSTLPDLDDSLDVDNE